MISTTAFLHLRSRHNTHKIPGCKKVTNRDFFTVHFITWQWNRLKRDCMLLFASISSQCIQTSLLNRLVMHQLFVPYKYDHLEAGV